jgi:hypothetical protein|tara:strand:+ start:1628 stop:1843 length:216 start_codon:yes stop_codon:yes gene_type:complete
MLERAIAAEVALAAVPTREGPSPALAPQEEADSASALGTNASAYERNDERNAAPATAVSATAASGADSATA